MEVLLVLFLLRMQSWFIRPQCLARARHRLEKVACSRLWWLFRWFPKFELEWSKCELCPRLSGSVLCAFFGIISFGGVPSSRAIVPLDGALHPVILFERVEAVCLARVEENVPIDALKVLITKTIISCLHRFRGSNSLLFWWSQSFLWRVWSSRSAAQLAARLRHSTRLPFFLS